MTPKDNTGYEMTDKQNPKPRGRPRKAPLEGERNSLGLRVTAELKRKIEEAAANSGRSQSQEAEYRLEQSFANEDFINRTFGDVGGLRLVQAIATAKNMAEHKTKQSMFHDQETAQIAREIIDGILDYLIPSKSPEEIDETDPTAGQQAVIGDPGARSQTENIRDVILEPLKRLRR